MGFNWHEFNKGGNSIIRGRLYNNNNNNNNNNNFIPSIVLFGLTVQFGFLVYYFFIINFTLYVLKKLYDLLISKILTFVAPFGMVNMMSPLY